MHAYLPGAPAAKVFDVTARLLPALRWLLMYMLKALGRLCITLAELDYTQRWLQLLVLAQMCSASKMLCHQRAHISPGSGCCMLGRLDCVRQQ
jgi:hypothetical protein